MRKKTIGFIQMVNPTFEADGSRADPEALEPLLEKHGLRTNDGWHLDFLNGWDVKYYNLAWKGKESRWGVRKGFGEHVGEKGFAELTDLPGWDNKEEPRLTPKGGSVLYRFETAAVDVETGDVLGVVRWGFRIPVRGGGPLQLFAVTHGDTVSGDFKDALIRANGSGLFKKVELK
jgi:hypothetical protein